MFYNSAPNRRIQTLYRIINNIKPTVIYNNTRAYVSSETVSIGNTIKEIEETSHPEYVPQKYYRDDLPQSVLHHLRWLIQKDNLHQDVFLVGKPGPNRRRIALQYLELIKREHEHVALSRDTTESDLKQRREISMGTATYFDQSAVKAAIEGRVLILEGIEKAERNVLPVLNNLLENREMQLEDGRLLIPAGRYDTLLNKHGKDNLEKWKLVRVDEKFRIIALGLPVPKYRGNPLDPPLRSRFQARDISSYSYEEWYQELTKQYPNAPQKTIEQLLSCAFAISSQEVEKIGFPDFPLDNLNVAGSILEKYPNISAYDIFYRLYPYKTFLKDGIKNLEELISNFISFKDIPYSNNLNNISSDDYIETEYQNKVISDMLQSANSADFCLIGSSGSGKSMLINKLSEILSTEVENIILYQDMTSRDLVQQRTTLPNGDTTWSFSPLVQAAIDGKIAVLDGIDRIHPSTLSVLHRLVQDRELQVYDGKRLIRSDRFKYIQEKYKISSEELNKNGIYEINKKFRIVAIGQQPNISSTTGNWLSPEILSLFVFHELRNLTKEEEIHIISSKYGKISDGMLKIIQLAHILRNSKDDSLKKLSGHLSTRQLLRIAYKYKKYNYSSENIYEILSEAFMIQFLPSLTRKALEKTIENIGISTFKTNENNFNVKYEIKNNILTIGNTSTKLSMSENNSRVPNVTFHDIPHHIKIMEQILQDILIGHHVLLVGNQGVGKNKIIDRLLYLLNRPREYIQLHRDTTVQTLTSQPAVIDGKLIHQDSPLVQAAKHGKILVIDEADKAPTNVTCILKSLAESGEMILGDNRRITKNKRGTNNDIQLHPDFRMIVLANRPGFPFLGNDFFGALGDLFSCHSVDNPPRKSEIQLLKMYGPNVDVKILEKLVDIFGELRNMADMGLVNYPYSTREVVNIVKHLEKYPNTDLEDVIFNVFDFDRYSPEMLQTIGEVLSKYGFAEKNVIVSSYMAKKRAKEHLQVTVERYSGKDVSGPKHGKEDPKNEPHVGGNTWAGGTGGRDTAGLGGKGGPYRLDKGHKVHQLSDEEKASVPEHIQKAAREAGRKAFAEKLKEIGMSGYDHNVYEQFSGAVRREVQNLRVILGNLQAKNKERQWSRHQTTGELDDVKLIDGILGEKTIFRRRAEKEPELGTPQIKPKLFRVVVDVSGSMYRFNGYDGRLDRELEAVVLVMEAFEGFEDKIKYDIIGHSGDTYNVVFVPRDNPPKNNMERLTVIRTMHAHSQYCWTGDNTLESTEWAINQLSEEDCDEAICVVLSDANLQRYGIPASQLSEALTSKSNVSSYAIFIGSLGDQAERLTQNLPAGRSFICNDTRELPHILNQIFSSSVNV